MSVLDIRVSCSDAEYLEEFIKLHEPNIKKKRLFYLAQDKKHVAFLKIHGVTKKDLQNDKNSDILDVEHIRRIPSPYLGD